MWHEKDEPVIVIVPPNCLTSNVCVEPSCPISDATSVKVTTAPPATVTGIRDVVTVGFCALASVMPKKDKLLNTETKHDIHLLTLI